MAGAAPIRSIQGLGQRQALNLVSAVTEAYRANNADIKATLAEIDTMIETGRVENPRVKEVFSRFKKPLKL